jgi:hypothetical protein
LDIADHILFKAVGIKKVEIDKRSFLKLSFANDGINLGNILDTLETSVSYIDLVHCLQLKW